MNELRLVHASVNSNLTVAQEKLNTALVKISHLEAKINRLTE